MAVVVGAATLAVLAPTVGSTTAHAERAGEPGMIVVADRGNGRIQAFYPDGTFAFMFEHDGASVPVSVAVGPDGRIVVGDNNCCAESTVHVYNPDGTFAFKLASNFQGGGLGTIGAPADVAVGPDGRIVVAEEERVQVFNPDGTFALAFGSRTGEDRLVHVGAIAVGPDGKIVVFDRGPDVDPILTFHPNGTLESTSALGGWHLSYDASVDVGPDGQIAVADRLVRVYHPVHHSNGTTSFTSVVLHRAVPLAHHSNGTNATTSFTDVGFYPAPDVAVGPDGRIVVSDRSNHRVEVYHPNGTFALGFGSYGRVQSGFDRPTDAAVGPDGRIVVAEPSNHSIRVFHPNGTPAFSFGSHGSSDGAFYTPREVAVGPDGRIVVGDTGKNRILVFNPDGSPALAFGSHGHGKREIYSLSDVAVGPDGRIVVVDIGSGGYGRARVFSPDGMSVSDLAGGYWSPLRAASGWMGASC